VKNIFPFLERIPDLSYLCRGKSYKEGDGDVPFSIFHEYRITGTGDRKNAGKHPGK
jgi:hypothetical protein